MDTTLVDDLRELFDSFGDKIPQQIREKIHVNINVTLHIEDFLYCINKFKNNISNDEYITVLNAVKKLQENLETLPMYIEQAPVFKTLEDIMKSKDISVSDKSSALICLKKVANYYDRYGEEPVWGNSRITIGNQCRVYKIYHDLQVSFILWVEPGSFILLGLADN